MSDEPNYMDDKSNYVTPDNDVENLYQWAAIQEIMKLRNAIRYHRDQRGDDRCWLDDQRLYESLPETVAVDHTLPPKEEFLKSCSRFHDCRQGKSFKDMDKCYDTGEYRSLNVPEQKGLVNEQHDSTGGGTETDKSA